MAKDDSSSQENEDAQKKIPVYVASFSLPVAVIEDPATKEITAEARPGGLGIAVNAALPKDGPYELKRWVGISENYKAKDKTVDTEKQERVNKAFLEGDTHNFKFAYVAPEVRDALYTKAANQLIYPMVLELDDKIDPEATLKGYEAGNKALADELISTIKEDNNGVVPEDTMVWVHDYQILSVPKYIKEEAPEAKVGFFMHTPFPEIAPSNLLETEQAFFKTALENVVQADNLQFHTQQFKDDFLKTLENFGITNTPAEKEAMEAKVEVNPIGIPKEMVTEMTNERFSEVMSEKVTDSTVITGPVSQDPEEVTPDYQMVEKHFDKSPLHEAVEDKMKQWVKLKGPDDNKGNLRVDPDMINIASVGRFDYTKGLPEQLKGYQMFLNMMKQKGMDHPEDKFRMHVVASPARPIREDQKFAEDAKETMDDILQEYPGAINLIPFVPNQELPIFNSAMDIHIAPSKSDGYLISAGEAFVSRNLAIEQGLLGTSEREPSALILSTGAGMARTLENDKVDATSIIKPTAVNIANALLEQATAILAQRNEVKTREEKGKVEKIKEEGRKEVRGETKVEGKVEGKKSTKELIGLAKESIGKTNLADTRGFDKIPSQVNSTQEFGLKALTAITPESAKKAMAVAEKIKTLRKRTPKPDDAKKQGGKRQKL